MSTTWKITIPVALSEERADGFYIIGEASGPERDGHGTQMAPEAIMDFARQISDRVDAGDPLPYIDQHMKVGVLRELGHVMEALVTPSYHLRVAVRLDESNPAAMFLYNNLQRGKQYGMSVAGDGTEFVLNRDESTGAKVITFMKVVLREISNTTKPSWVPSLGTVLARSLDLPEGEGSMSEPVVAAPETETAAPVVEAVAPVVENSSTEETTTTETTETVVVEEVERARISKADAASIAAAFTDMATKIAALGIDLAAPVTPETPAAPVVENSETGDETTSTEGAVVERDLAAAIAAAVATEVERSLAPMQAVLEQQKAYIEQLEKLPAGKVPAPVVREKFEAPVGPDLAKMTNAERLAYALANSGLYSN